MDSETMKEEFPEPEQRSAVCSSQWARKDNAKARSGSIAPALSYPIVTGMIVLLALAGCATAQQKGEAYRQAAEKFTYPEKLRICYTREGDSQHGTEHRCFGEDCELPPCGNDD